MMPLEILKAIEFIDKRIEKLQQVKQTLSEEFGGKQVQPDNQKQTSLIGRKGFRLIRPAGVGSTRRDALINLLREEGPLSRSEIIRKSNIPKGTIATLLNDKERFESRDGKWHYIAEKEKPSAEVQ